MQILKQGLKADIKVKQNHKTAITQTSQNDGKKYVVVEKPLLRSCQKSEVIAKCHWKNEE